MFVKFLLYHKKSVFYHKTSKAYVKGFEDTQKYINKHRGSFIFSSFKIQKKYTLIQIIEVKNIEDH